MTSPSSPRMLDQWWRLGGIAAILFVVLFIVGAIIVQGDTPMTDSSASEIRTYFADNGQKYMVGDFLIALSFVFLFMPFASAFREFLGRAEATAPVWSRLFFSGALLLTAVGAATSGLQGALAFSAADFTDDNILKTVVDANLYSFATAFPMLVALMVLSASIVILRTGVLWRWLGLFGIVFAPAAVVSSLSVLDSDPNSPLGILGFVVFIAWGVWMLAVGIGLLRRAAPPAPMA